MSIKIGVAFPSRGLAFSRTAQELLDNLEGYDYDIFFSHGLPIPLCFEKPLKQALKGDYTHIWFVEDDMILPEETLSAMLLMDDPVVTMDYPVSPKGQGAVLEADGRVYISGTGCLLVKREVFDHLKKPYFRTDVKWGIVNHGKFIRITAQPNDSDTYGSHDVTFSMKLLKAEIPISVAGKIGQRKLVALGKSGSNNGAHQIEEWHKVVPNFLIKQTKEYPVVPVGKLVTVQTKDGELNVHPSHAKKLIAKGIATASPKRTVGVDFGDVLL